MFNVEHVHPCYADDTFAYVGYPDHSRCRKLGLLLRGCVRVLGQGVCI